MRQNQLYMDVLIFQSYSRYTVLWGTEASQTQKLHLMNFAERKVVNIIYQYITK